MPPDVDAFMATMVMHSHPLSLEGAMGLVREYYGLDAHAVRLTGERDENFRVRAGDGSESCDSRIVMLVPGGSSKMSLKSVRLVRKF